jgi:hypothetical protein
MQSHYGTELVADYHRNLKNLALMRRMLFPYASSEGFKVGLHHFQDGSFIAGPTPVVALKAADQRLTVVVDLHQRGTAGGTDLVAH